MPSNKIKCARCHGWKKRRKGTFDPTQKTYTCLSCRWAIIAKSHFSKVIVRTKAYRDLRADVLKEVREYETSQAVPQERQKRFILNIQTLMNHNFIRDYKFNISDNKLNSITLFNLPLIGQLDIPVYETEKQNKKTEGS